jgi:thioredoxin reductase
VIYDTVIVGGGAAGLSAALVLGRCIRTLLVCDSGRYRNQRSTALHCYMGHDGVAPKDLLDLARRQVKRYDCVEFVGGLGVALERIDGAFAVSFDDGRSVRARTLLVATGVVDELPPIEGIEQLFGRSVHVCPYCDGWEHRDAPVAVFGRGEKGAGLASLLHQWTSDLVLCTHGPSELTDDQGVRLERLGIVVREEPIVRLEGANGCLEAVVFGGGLRIQRKAMFFNTGQHPRSRLLEQLGCRYGEKGIEYDDDGTTSVPGVYVAGDVSRDVQLVIIAAAEGARAALAINKALLRMDGKLGLE